MSLLEVGMKYIIFNPSLPGEPLDPIITDNIIAAAKRGRITPTGEKLRLVPDKRGAKRDKNGIRFTGYGSVKHLECLPLKSLVLA